jgi:(S)-2-hydroxy-acid oxidase
MASKPAVYSIDDLEEYAGRHLPKMVRDYFNGGSVDGVMLEANRREYQRYYIKPWVLRDVLSVKISATVLPGSGGHIPFPC